jgi:hypothetical protein
MRQRIGPRLHLLAQPHRGVAQLDVHPFHRSAEPFIEIAIQNRVTEQKQEHHREQAERQRAEYKLRADARAFLVPLPLQIQLHRLLEQHETKRDRQQEDQRGDRPEQECFGRVGGTKFAEGQGNLPHHQRHHNGQNHQASAEKMPFAHRYINYMASVTRPAATVMSG